MNLQDYTSERVKVTVNLTPEAARTLLAYAGERNRGRFLSDLIMEQRRRDEEEGQRIAREAAKTAGGGGSVASPSKKRKKGR